MVTLNSYEREACWIARRLNQPFSAAILKKWEKRAEPYQPLVNALRDKLPRLDKGRCIAAADEMAVNEYIAENADYAAKRAPDPILGLAKRETLL